MSAFFTKYRSLSKKTTWFVTRIQIITKKSSTYTQGDYCGLSYDINIYIPEYHRFDKKLLMSGFLGRFSSCWAKEERDLSRKYTLYLKKARHTLKATIVVFHTTLIFISQSSTVLRKNCLCQHFLQNIFPVSKKRTWFVTQIQIITKKSSHTLKETIVVFHTTLIFISQSSTVLTKNCLCQYFLQNIVLWAKKERDLSRKYTL